MPLPNTNSFTEELAVSFEKASPQKPKTLAEAVSDSLLERMPRLSPDLFNKTRVVHPTLTPNQLKRVKEYQDRIMETHNEDSAFGSSCSAEIPRFTLAHVPRQKTITYKNACAVLGSLDINDRISDLRIGLRGSVLNFRSGSNNYMIGSIRLQGRLEWELPFKLDVNVDVPTVPTSFIDLGDEAIGLYSDIVRQMPRNLREKTEYTTPSMGILWAPTDSSLYVSGEIPEPTRSPQPNGDPALVLEIQDSARSYHHVVAVWNIGEELPFRNWIAEYSEGRSKK